MAKKKISVQQAKKDVLSLFGGDLEKFKRESSWRFGEHARKQPATGHPHRFRGWIKEREVLKATGYFPDDPKEAAALKKLETEVEGEDSVLGVDSILESGDFDSRVAGNVFSQEKFEKGARSTSPTHWQDTLAKHRARPHRSSSPQLYDDMRSDAAGINQWARDRDTPWFQGRVMDYNTVLSGKDQARRIGIYDEESSRYDDGGFMATDYRPEPEVTAESSAYGLDESRPYDLRATYPEGVPFEETEGQKLDKLLELKKRLQKPQ